MESSVLESLNAIGGTVSIPAALLVGYLYLRVKQLGAEVEKLRTERNDDRYDRHYDNYYTHGIPPTE